MLPISSIQRIVIVGASIAGIRVAEHCRRRGYDKELVLIGEEVHLPYDRPALSKKIILGEASADDIGLRRLPYEELNLDLRLGVRAVALDGATKTITLSDGSHVQGDRIFICTGSCPRLLPHIPPLRGIQTLRYLEDAEEIRRLLGENERIVVAGGGFIGAEVAAAARQLGKEVVLVEPASTLMIRGLGECWGQEMEKVHRQHGVDVRTGTGVKSVRGSHTLEAVELTDGDVIETSVMVVGIGATPNTEWLKGSGVHLDNGVVTDAYGETNVPDVYAVGDVAHFQRESSDQHVRVEHWTNAEEMARAVVRNAIHEGREVYHTIPMVWSDQYDLKLQIVGYPGEFDREVVTMLEEETGHCLILRGKDGFLTSAIGFNRASTLVRMKKLIPKNTDFDKAVAFAEQQYERMHAHAEDA